MTTCSILILVTHHPAYTVAPPVSTSSLQSVKADSFAWRVVVWYLHVQTVNARQQKSTRAWSD